jgi:hypothetical protein
MTRARISEKKIERRSLSTGRNYVIDLVVENEYSHCIEVSYLSSSAQEENNDPFYFSQFPQSPHQLILPFDPTDCSVVGVIHQEFLNCLGDETNDFLKVLAETLTSQLGAKQFIVVPATVDLPGFTTPENSGFERLKQRVRTDFYHHCETLVGEYPHLRKKLNTDFRLIGDMSNEEELLSDLTARQRCEEISRLLDGARFTDGKMQEYKAEDLHGKMSRLNNKFIQPFVMLDKQDRIVGMIRAVAMGRDFVYLADEVIAQEIVGLDEFTGNTVEEQKAKRELFLLAYLFYKISGHNLSTYSHLMIIAAKDREKLYTDVGFEAFPQSLEKTYFSKHLKGIKVLMKLSAPGPALIEAQQKIKSLPMPVPANTSYWTMATTAGVGALLAGVGVFAYNAWKKTSALAADITKNAPRL